MDESRSTVATTTGAQLQQPLIGLLPLSLSTCYGWLVTLKLSYNKFAFGVNGSVSLFFKFTEAGNKGYNYKCSTLCYIQFLRI